MNKKLVLSLVFLCLNASLFGEGFVSNTLVATLHGPLEPIGRIYPGLDAYSLNEQGKIDFARIVARQTSEKYLYNMIELEGGTKIFGDYDQLFYCPNRDAWVKLVELNEGEDSVYSYAKKKPLLVLSIKQVDTAICNIRTGIHRISLDKYGVYFVSKDLILVHNFAILLPSLGAIFLAHAADFAVAAGLALVTGYITEKVSEKVIPLVQNALCSSPNVEAVSKLAAPKIDSDQKKNIPPSTPPPGNGGGPENIAKIGPILAAGEEVRKNSDPAFKAAGNVVSNVVNTVKNVLPGNNALQAGLKIETEVLRNSTHETFKHILVGTNNEKWDKHKFDKIGKTASEVAEKIISITQKALAGGKLPESGIYVIRDMVDGHIVEVRGIVQEGLVKFSTAFVDKKCC